MTRARALILVAAQAVAAAVTAGALEAQAADSVNHLRDRWQVSLAGSGFRLGSTIRFNASDGSQGSEISTNDLEAYNLYLQGVELLNRGFNRRNSSKARCRSFRRRSIAKRSPSPGSE